MPGYKVCEVFLRDGTLVKWKKGSASPSAEHTFPCRLVMQDDRNIVMYDGKGEAIWASGTQDESWQQYPASRGERGARYGVIYGAELGAALSVIAGCVSGGLGGCGAGLLLAPGSGFAFAGVGGIWGGAIGGIISLWD